MVSDHLGNKYKSIEDMCTHYSINPSTYKFRIKSGLSVENALTAPINKKTCIDHLGNVFDSLNKMCGFYGINANTYKTRIRAGKSIEEALTEKKKVPSDKGNSCVDHLGNEYRSYAAMAKAYGVAASVVRDRIDRGLKIEEVLEKKEVADHTGRKYRSETQMCKAYGVHISVYKSRLSRGWSQEDALTKSPLDSREVHGTACVDHMGNKYKSQREMCRIYDIDYATFRHRISQGATIEEALTHNEIKDHNGIIYRSEFEMCRANHIDNSTYRYRIREGFSIEEALTIPNHYSLGEYRVSKVLDLFQETGRISGYLHNVQIKKLFEIINQLDEYHNFMDAYEKELNGYNIFISRRKLAKFRFDFSIINDVELFAFIEYDGIQHFKFVDLFFKTFADFFRSLERDIAKNNFAEINKVPLLRIRYDQIDEKTVTTMIDDLIKSPKKYIDEHNMYLTNEEYMSVFKNAEEERTPFQIEGIE